MRGFVRENVLEAAIGLLVVLVAAWFMVFAWRATGGGARDSIRVTALFPAANGVAVGTDVRVAGLKVGTVEAQRLDPKSYQAEVTLALDKDVHLPSDSSAAITAEGLLGGSYVSLMPGGSETPLKDGDAILDTQGSIDMLGLIGSFVNRTGGEGSGGAGADQGEGAGGGSMETPAR